MKKLTSTFVALFGILSFCTAENVGKTGENDNMKIEKSKLDLSLFKTDAEFMQTFRNFSDGENSRLRAGNKKQIDFFGERTRESWLNGAESSRIINFWLADNCFGDYYTRKGLTDRQRELITFCFLASQGGCEPQLSSHVRANINVENSKEYLIAVVSQILPYIGYPRSLNAIRVVNEVN